LEGKPMRRINLTWLPILFALAGPVMAVGEREAVDKLLDRIARQEQQFIQELRTRSAILETYIQETPDPAGDTADVVRDHYFLGRLDFSKGLEYTAMAARGEVPKSSRTIFFLKNRSTVFVPTGFAQMALPDSAGLDRRSYRMDFVRREFLGEIRCLLFDVEPLDKKAPGKFKGRIWVEDQDFRIVRFNGTYTNSSTARMYFHFDSWRVNVAPGRWVPAFIYVEEAGSEKPGPVPRFKAQARLWGYHVATGGKLEELVSIAVEADKPVKDGAHASDLSPLESQRIWERQAEANILERLEKSGLLAPPGPVDEVLNTVVNNLIVTNNLGVEAQCRVLLTTPIETFSVGQTIVISRGLIDVLPDEASLAVVLSTELAHIALGHRTDTHFAFSDQTMLGDGELLSRLQLARPDAEVQQAGAKAAELLAKSPYQAKLSNAALFLEALAARITQLPCLIRANLGNQLAGAGKPGRLAPLAGPSPDPSPGETDQIAALPLGSRVHLDPWSNEVLLLKTKAVPILSARDKLPFEITPFIISLSRAEGRANAQEPAPPEELPAGGKH
jgi:hypothetical protein